MKKTMVGTICSLTCILFLVNCGKAQAAAEKAIKRDYKNIEVLAGEIPEWKEKDYPSEGSKAGTKKTAIKKLTAEVLKTDMESGMSFILVDVRERDEFTAGHLQVVLNLPLSNLEKSYSQLPKDKKIVLYYNSGSRSNSAAQLLLQHGYKNIEEMEGFKFWAAKGLPSIKDK